jgi:LemA protein
MHEKKLQTEVASLRAVQMDDAAGKTILAIAENYPSLQADQNFLLLQKQLAEIQEKLAGSQSYLVDATTLYNQRVQSFPYFLFTPMVGLRALPMPSFG